MFLTTRPFSSTFMALPLSMALRSSSRIMLNLGLSRGFAKVKDTGSKTPTKGGNQKGGSQKGGGGGGRDAAGKDKSKDVAKTKAKTAAGGDTEVATEIKITPVNLRESIGKFVPLFHRSSSGKILSDPSIPKQLKEQFMLLQSSSLLLRDQTKSFLEKIASKSANNAFVIDGVQGSGKTATLLHTVNYCANENWFVFYVPSVRPFAAGKSTFVKQQGTQSYSQPEAGLTLFQQLKTLNPHWFDKLKLKKDHRLGDTFTAAGRKLVTVNQGITFSKLAEVAEANPQQSSQALVVLLEELAEQKEVPVLVAIDDVNYLFGPTSYDDPDDQHQFKKQKLHATRFLLLDKLNKFVTKKESIEFGAVVSAATRTIDNSLLQEGTLHLDHHLPTFATKGITSETTANYDRDELKLCIDHYRASGLFMQKGPLGEADFHRLRLISGGNGKELFKVVTRFM